MKECDGEVGFARSGWGESVGKKVDKERLRKLEVDEWVQSEQSFLKVNILTNDEVSQGCRIATAVGLGSLVLSLKQSWKGFWIKLDALAWGYVVISHASNDPEVAMLGFMPVKASSEVMRSKARQGKLF